MLQNLTEGETGKSYDKTINLRKLKKNFERLFRIISYTFCMHTEKRIANTSVKSFEFTAAVRGFHVYREIWLTYINDTLKCLHEFGNTYDVFAIECIKGNMIGHLLREISRPTKYLLDQGAIVTATITSEHYRKSSLFQGGLGIRWVITVTMIVTVRGHLLLKRYEQFVKTLLFALILQKQIFPMSKQMTGFVQRRRKRTQRTR